MATVTRRRVLQTAAVAASGLALPLVRTAGAAVGSAPDGGMTLAWHTNIAPRWLDPLQHDGGATPDNFLNVVQDALIKNFRDEKYDHLALAEHFEFSEDAKRATARLVEGLIPVIDGFEHALAAHREAEYANYRKGFELIYKQLLDHLAKLGVERLDPVGKPFDPHLHQAVDRAEAKDREDGTILQVFQPGYVFHGRVLRPAMVRVAVHPNPASKEAVN